MRSRFRHRGVRAHLLKHVTGPNGRALNIAWVRLRAPREPTRTSLGSPTSLMWERQPQSWNSPDLVCLPKKDLGAPMPNPVAAGRPGAISAHDDLPDAGRKPPQSTEVE